MPDAEDSPLAFPQDETFIPLEVAKRRFEQYFSTSTFYRFVGEGRIRKRLPQGKLRGAEYSLRDIERLTQQATSLAPVQTQTMSATDWITVDDLPHVQALDLRLYGPEDIVDFSITYGWWKKNNRMCRILFDVNDRRNVWGVLTIMPMDETVIFRILRKEMAEKEITADMIQEYKPNHSYTGYIASVLILPEYQSHLRSLLVSMLDYWCEQYPSMTLSRVYAFASSNEGYRLIRHLFFSPRYDLGENAFELDPLRPNNPSRLIRRLQDCIHSKEE